MDAEKLFYGICAAVILIMIIYYFRRERKIFSLFFGAATGFIALHLVNKYGIYIDTDIPLNTFNVIGSTVLGVPFVLCLVILNML